MTSSSLAEPPAQHAGASRHLGLALVLICLAQLMVVLDASIANIALPYIQEDLGFSASGLTWVVTGYSLTFGGLLLLGGRLGDLYGRRRIFMVGLLIFAAASLVGGLAQDPGMLLTSRAVQGVGAALASPSALALITTTFPAGPARSRAFAVYAAMSGVGAAVGLILGGWLTGIHPGIDGWRLTFLINVPIGIVAAILAPRVLAESDRHTGELDVPGGITVTAGLLAVVYGLSRASTDGWGDTLTMISLIGGAALIAIFLVIETRVKHPLMPLRVFASGTRAASYLVMMLIPAAMFAMFYYLSQYVQDVKGYTPLHTGVAFLPFTVGLILSATVTSSLVNRIDPRYIAGVGTLLAATGLYIFSRIPSDTSYPVSAVTGGYVAHILPGIIVMSIGMGMTFVTITLTAVHRLRPEDSGIGSGVLNTMQQVGGALGLSVLSTVAVHVMKNDLMSIGGAAAAAGSKIPVTQGSTAYGQAFAHGATTAFLVGSIMALAGSLVVWVFLNVKHTELAEDSQPEGAEPVHVG